MKFLTGAKEAFWPMLSQHISKQIRLNFIRSWPKEHALIQSFGQSWAKNSPLWAANELPGKVLALPASQASRWGGYYRETVYNGGHAWNSTQTNSHRPRNALHFSKSDYFSENCCLKCVCTGNCTRPFAKPFAQERIYLNTHTNIAPHF